MTKLESIINTVLEQLKPDLACETWVSRRRYFNQILRLAESLNITEPCQKLYDAFIADDNGSKERRLLHVRCVKLIDALAGTQAFDGNGILFNEQPMPTEEEVRKFFPDVSFPITTGVPIDYLIVKANFEMRHLNLTDSTIGQYKHSWNDIKRYFYSAGSLEYNETLIQNFIQEINNHRNNGSMKEWKWKINRKAAYILIEVANTGCFHWRTIHKSINCNSLEIENIRLQYVDSLKQKNLSKSTIELHDYVFRRAMGFAEIETAKDLQLLSPENVQLIVVKLSEISSRRSMATIIPILRSILNTLHKGSFITKNLSGVIVGAFVQRGSVASYISEKDQAELVVHLDKESKRTKAVILLAFRLGMRDCDIPI